jgi:hypothetical protein
MSNLLEHAKSEFKIAGYKPVDEVQEDDPNKWIQENVFSKQGHSGFSAQYCIDVFSKLASYETISPLKFTDDEWVDVSGESGGVMYQNKRHSAVFKAADDKPYYLDAIVFIDSDGHAFTCGAVSLSNYPTKLSSSNYIKTDKLFEGRTFYIDVIAEPDASEFDYALKDPSQLSEVIELYDLFYN